jgi:hypothetical protein
LQPFLLAHTIRAPSQTMKLDLLRKGFKYMNRITHRSLFALLVLFSAAALAFNHWTATKAATTKFFNTLPANEASDTDAPAKTAKANGRAQAAPTFSKEVSRIFQKNCQTCHHPGDIAPF